MMNFIWVGLVVIAVIAGIFTGNIAAVQEALFSLLFLGLPFTLSVLPDLTRFILFPQMW